MDLANEVGPALTSDRDGAIPMTRIGGQITNKGLDVHGNSTPDGGIDVVISHSTFVLVDRQDRRNPGTNSPHGIDSHGHLLSRASLGDEVVRNRLEDAMDLIRRYVLMAGLDRVGQNGRHVALMAAHVPLQEGVEGQDQQLVIAHQPSDKVDHEELDLEAVRVGSGTSDLPEQSLGQPLRIVEHLDGGIQLLAVLHAPIGAVHPVLLLLHPVLRPLPLLDLLANPVLLLAGLLGMEVQVDGVGAFPFLGLVAGLVLGHLLLDAEEEPDGAGHDVRVGALDGAGHDGDGAVVGPDAAAVQLGDHVGGPSGGDVGRRVGAAPPVGAAGRSRHRRGLLLQGRVGHDPVEEGLDGAVDLLVALALLVDVTDVVDDVAVEHLAQALVGHARHDAEEELEQIEGRDGPLVAHEDEGRDARLADVAVELDGRGRNGHGQISSASGR
mmetsp:Transcript_25476/g.73678  ORF Transcript_25476/g.73678 Transcript_25476/m.73678 type:complete len:439 (+) Transcript_25476:928-2244(+)